MSTAKLLYRRLDSALGAVGSRKPPARIIEKLFEDVFSSLHDDLGLAAAFLFVERDDALVLTRAIGWPHHGPAERLAFGADHVTRCWDVWVESLADETPARWLEACPIDERSHWWWTADGAPGSLADDRRNWRTIRQTDDDWVSLRPVYVDVFGDVGIIHMYGHWRAKTPNGSVTTEAKRTEVFQRRSGRWVFIGAQSTPVTPADAAPYRRQWFVAGQSARWLAAGASGLRGPSAVRIRSNPWTVWTSATARG